MFKQSISKQIWHDTYKWETDTCIEDTWKRIATAIASVEKKEIRKEWEEKFYDLLKDFKFVPGGRVISNAGTNLKNTTLINCFVSGFEGKNLDSIDSIYKELLRQAKILASEGGYGINFSILRPRGSFVEGIGVETCGVVEFMKLWDVSSSVLTAGSGIKKIKNKGKNKIRKGAMMSMIDIWHPSVEEFIKVKQQPGVLTKFNMTVLLSNDFIDAVKNKKRWDLIFPDTNHPKYYDEWDGNINKWKEKKYAINVWKTYEDANELYDMIMTSTYNRNEPGVAFIDRVNELNNLYYCEHINASNPCLTGDTLITTKKGKISIKDLIDEKNVYVKTYNENTGEFELKPAVAFLTKKNAGIIEIETTSGRIIKVTPDHKVYTLNRGWVEAQNLSENDELLEE